MAKDNKERLVNLVNDSARPRIMVVGDVILDKYLLGEADRLSAEAPVAVVRFDREEFKLGGAANVAHNLVALGAEVDLVGVIGDDHNGRIFCEEARQLGVPSEGVVAEAGRVTTTKTRIIAHDQQMIRIDQEVTLPVSGKTAKALLAYLAAKVGHCDMLIISDYAKGVLSPELLKELAGLTGPEKTVIVAPKGWNFSKYQRATVIVPNAKEAAEATRLKCTSDDEVERAAKEILASLRCQAVVITRGKQGMTLFQGDGGCYHLRAQARSVYDVTGAGDTVVSAFGYFTASGADWLESLKLANLAASIAVSKFGTAVVSRRELLATLANPAFIE